MFFLWQKENYTYYFFQSEVFIKNLHKFMFFIWVMIGLADRMTDDKNPIQKPT